VKRLRILTSPRNTKAQVAAPMGGAVEVPSGAAHVPRNTVPTAAPHHTILAAASVYRIIALVCAIGITAIYVLNPFPNIPSSFASVDPTG